MIPSRRARLPPWLPWSNDSFQRGWSVRLVSVFRPLQTRSPGELERPRLDLSGPILTQAFETLIQGTEAQGGIEYWTDALKLKSRMFQQALGQGHPADLPLETFKGLCAFMASVRRRIGPYLEQPSYDKMVDAHTEIKIKALIVVQDFLRLIRRDFFNDIAKSPTVAHNGKFPWDPQIFMYPELFQDGLFAFLLFCNNF